jgi:hypothetical protein
MTKEEQQKKRIRFNWQDGVAMAVVVSATAGIFIWALTKMNQSSQSGSTILVRYNNQEVMDNLEVISSSGAKRSYSLSFRRDLQAGESYVDTVDSTKVAISLTALSKITDFSPYEGLYFIITSPSDVYDGLSGLYGPQVDVKVSNGGFQVVKETSPTNDCSKQGFTNIGNYPVVCLPNHIDFRIVNSVSKPDA